VEIACIYARADVAAYRRLVAALGPLLAGEQATLVPFEIEKAVCPDADHFAVVVALLTDALLAIPASVTVALGAFARRVAVIVAPCSYALTSFVGWQALAPPDGVATDAWWRQVAHDILSPDAEVDTVAANLREGADAPAEPRTPIKVLFVAAGPRDAPALALKTELEKTTSRLYRARAPRLIDFKEVWSAQFADLTGPLQDEKPDIVHFSGHGTDGGDLLFEGNDSLGARIPSRAFVELLSTESAKQHVRCVLLNACYTEGLALQLVAHVDFVIGSPAPIGDAAAIAFSEAFYPTLAREKSVKEAFKFGLAQFIGAWKAANRDISETEHKAQLRAVEPQIHTRKRPKQRNWPAPPAARGRNRLPKGH
jgi:hypothetical protein